MLRIMTIEGYDEDLVNKAVDKCFSAINDDVNFLNVELKHFKED